MPPAQCVSGRTTETTHRPFSARRSRGCHTRSTHKPHNCTSHVVCPSCIFRPVNVLAIERSRGEEIKKLNKRVKLKHTPLNLTKTLCYSLGLFWSTLPQNRILFILRRKTENLPLVQQEEGEKDFWGKWGWRCAEFAGKLCHSTQGELENTWMNTSLKNKNAWGQPSSYCQTILFNQAFLLQGQEAANQVCILLWKKKQREGEFSWGIVHTAVVGCS